MTSCIDCFILWQSDEQVRGTLESLQADPNVQSVNFLRKDSPSSTDTIKRIAETATAPYTLLYTKHDTRQSGQRQFDYVDPRNRSRQEKMEQACTPSTGIERLPARRRIRRGEPLRRRLYRGSFGGDSRPQPRTHHRRCQPLGSHARNLIPLQPLAFKGLDRI